MKLNFKKIKNSLDFCQMFQHLQESHFSWLLYSYPGEKKDNPDSRQISPKISSVMTIFKSKIMTYLK